MTAIPAEARLETLEPDRILFAVDWPYADNTQGVNWLENCPIGADTKQAVFSGNARALLGI